MNASDLIIPDECVPFIRMQRSRYSAAKVPDPAQVKAKYAAWVGEDFIGMAPYLPNSVHVKTILEIGCGMAALQVFLKWRYPDAQLHLLDGDGTDVVGGYFPTSKPYNSRKLTEKLLAANGVTVTQWHDINTKEHLKFDLIVSMASWGYHYPFATYDVEGKVICDLRRTNERALIAKIWAAGGQHILKGPKYERCAFTVSGSGAISA